ncbi:MAG: hypothetical protein IIT60_00220 [Muribaculaceae bacterium]|nr:hypothetical protein [Muribaculaceae bacterium]
MDKKLTVNIEFSRDQVATVATLAGVELNQEIWDKATEKPVNISMSDIDDKEVQLGLLIAIVGIAMGKAL